MSIEVACWCGKLRIDLNSEGQGGSNLSGDVVTETPEKMTARENTALNLTNSPRLKEPSPLLSRSLDNLLDPNALSLSPGVVRGLTPAMDIQSPPKSPITSPTLGFRVQIKTHTFSPKASPRMKI
ncbi:hypothetical protein PROFUN_08354 [Planoprotostelium fungivorum]|uniref:Uncharacterized protein n=1 Tax=Planoprotostelium fungivorum TaxID=1890364 RepID=A0A2P6NI39_9EUKA|nr:hypothetical protein PROFUN_08354 [Planoprotostelium fungivorum]